jgi:hypothetical protein
MNNFPEILILILISLFVSCSDKKSISDVEKGFLNPLCSARPYVWWHWINGNISKEGITRDLEAMAKQGIGGASIFNLQRQAEEGPVTYGSEKWQECISHAFAEAKRLGLELSFQNCGGWATSGGPWVTKDNAMKKLTWKKFQVKGAQKFSASLSLPGNTNDYYKDIRTMAYRSDDRILENLMDSALVKVSCDKEIRNKKEICDGDIVTEACILADGGNVNLIFEFKYPFEASSMFIKRTWPSYNGVNVFELSASQDNKIYKSILANRIRNDFESFDFKPVKARFYKFTVKGGFQDTLRIPEIRFNQDIYNFLPALNELNALAGFQVRERINPKKILNERKKPVKLNEIIDLTSNINNEGLLTWDIPEGNWTILRVGYTLTGKHNEGPRGSTGFESDKLSADATMAYFEGMKNVFLKDREAYIGNTLKSILMDSWESHFLNWTKNFADEFEQRRGYSIYPYLLVIAGELVENDEVSYRFLWDFRRTIADLLADNHFGKMADLCHENGLRLEVEAAGAQQAQKDPINYSSRVDIPMTEFWVKNFKPNGSFMDAISSGHIYDKKRISAESFTSPAGDWKMSPGDLKGYGDKVFCWGINWIKFHSYTHQPDETCPGWQMNPWGITMNRKMPWWDHVSVYFKYLQRAQYMLQQGNFKADVLLFYSEGAQTDLNMAYGNNVLSYLPKGYRFDGCDQNTILNRLKVKDHKLVLPDGASYRLLVLPEKLQNTPVLLTKIKELVNSGAIVYGPKPLHSPSLVNYPACDSTVRKIADEVWGEYDINGIIDHPYGKGKVLSGKPITEVLNEISIPDFEYIAENSSDYLDFIHREIGTTDSYFISNQESHPVNVTCKFRVTGKIPEFWDAETGTINKNVLFEQDKLFTSVQVRLESESSVFVVFKKTGNRNHIRKIDLNGNSLKENYSLSCNRIEVSKAGKYRIEYSDGNQDQFEINSIPDPIELSVPWKVSFDNKWGGPGEVVFDTLVSWTERAEDGIKYYSGKVIYEKEFEMDASLLRSNLKISLDLGVVDATARVELNGNEVGMLWKAPYRSDISGFLNPGRNQLLVEVANTWPNRIIGDLNSKDGKKYTWSNSTSHYNKDSELIKSGLKGPVKIRFIESVRINY